MSIDALMDVIRQCFVEVLLLAGPALAVSVVVGVGVGLFQAATQIHEMTLVFVPKFLLIAVLTLLIGHWQWGQLVRFTGRLFASLPLLIR
jgi:flagellar biosynthetic protein FliQ